MANIAHPGKTVNWLLAESLNHPVLVMLVLFLIASAVKVLDTFVLPLNEMVGELILTKALGFLLVVAYVWLCGRTLRDLGLHRERLGPALLIGAVSVCGLYLIIYGVQYIVLRASDEQVSMTLRAVDPKTGLSGGILFGLWMLLANVVNAAMEEGLFRGLMLRHFRIPFAALGAILLQATLFAIWHLNWPIEHLTSGESTLGESAFEAAALLVSTGISGLVYGYMYHRTNNLWAPMLAHFINNSILNSVFFRTLEGMKSGPDIGVFIALMLIGHLLMIPFIALLANRFHMPVVRPWGEFETGVPEFERS